MYFSGRVVRVDGSESSNGSIECCQDEVAYHLSHSIDDHDGVAFLTVIE